MVKLIFLLACVVVALQFVSADINGQFTDAKGATCKFNVFHVSNSERQLKVKCKLYVKKTKQTVKYDCNYCGDPHPCNWYQGNEVSYFAKLISALQVKQDACFGGSIQTSKKCNEIVFAAGAC